MTQMEEFHQHGMTMAHKRAVCSIKPDGTETDIVLHFVFIPGVVDTQGRIFTGIAVQPGFEGKPVMSCLTAML